MKVNCLGSIPALEDTTCRIIPGKVKSIRLAPKQIFESCNFITMPRIEIFRGQCVNPTKILFEA